MTENYQIEQKKWLHKITSTIYNEGVHVQYKTLFTEKDYKVKFTSILDSVEKQSIFSKWWCFFCILCVLWSVLIFFNTSVEHYWGNVIFVLSFLAFTSIKFYMSIKNIYILAKYPSLLFFYQKNPSEEELLKFIELIYAKKAEFESSNNTANEDMSKLSGLERLSELLEKDLITKEEFNKLKSELIGKDENNSFDFISLN